jgi:hypothetical protein
MAGGAVGYARIANYWSVGDCAKFSQDLERLRRTPWIPRKLDSWAANLMKSWALVRSKKSMI